MTEVMQRPIRPPGAPALAANGAPLRLTPGLGELRLPSCEDEPVPENARQRLAIEQHALCLCTRPPGREPLDGSLCWYDPAAGAFLPTRHELADDKRRQTDDKRQAAARAEASEAKVAELEAQLEKMRRRG